MVVGAESIANWATIISCVLEVILFGFVLFEFKYLRYEAKSSYDFEMEQKIESDLNLCPYMDYVNILLNMITRQVNTA